MIVKQAEPLSIVRHAVHLLIVQQVEPLLIRCSAFVDSEAGAAAGVGSGVGAELTDSKAARTKPSESIQRKLTISSGNNGSAKTRSSISLNFSSYTSVYAIVNFICFSYSYAYVFLLCPIIYPCFLYCAVNAKVYLILIGKNSNILNLNQFLACLYR